MPLSIRRRAPPPHRSSNAFEDVFAASRWHAPHGVYPARRAAPVRGLLHGQVVAHSWLARWAHEPFVYVTTVGRHSGRPHRIEIWFAARDGRIYLMSGGRNQADWVRNLQANPHVRVELGNEAYEGLARILAPDDPEDHLARELLVARYADAQDDLEEWGRTALPVVIEFAS